MRSVSTALAKAIIEKSWSRTKPTWKPSWTGVSRGREESTGRCVIVRSLGCSALLALTGRAEALGDAVQDDGEQHHGQPTLESQADVRPLDAGLGFESGLAV